MSVYDKSLEQIQSSYQFTDLEMAKMDYTLVTWHFRTVKTYQSSFSFSYFSLSSENFQNLQFAWLLYCRFAGFPAVFI